LRKWCPAGKNELTPFSDDSPGQAQHHRPVPLQHEGEGIAVARFAEALEQLAVVVRRAAPARQARVQIIHNGVR
jgi:hypothetical protein